jgi:chromate transporter
MDDGPTAPRGERLRTTLSELASLFLKLGTIGFGGPAAHIAMMEDEVVRRRQWLTREQFLDYLGATNLIPGPNSTEMAIHIGHARAGWPGLLIAGAAFILPSALIVASLAWVYVRFGALPEVAGILYGVKPVVIAVVIQALWGFGRSAVKSYRLAVLGLVAAAATFLGVHELVVLATAAAAGAILAHRPGTGGGAWKAAALAAAPSMFPVSTSSLAAGSATAVAAVSLGALFGVFVKIGAVLFGSGYVLLAFLRADLVERFGWLTERQLLDAVAVGQVTPGPVFTTATFVGYLVAGWPGAVVATIGIFLPAFAFVALSGPLVPRIRRSPIAGAVLNGVIVASLALMAVVTWQLGRAALVDAVTVLLAVVSVLLLVRFRLNSAWLVAGGAVIGLLAGS